MSEKRHRVDCVVSSGTAAKAVGPRKTTWRRGSREASSVLHEVRRRVGGPGTKMCCQAKVSWRARGGAGRRAGGAIGSPARAQNGLDHVDLGDDGDDFNGVTAAFARQHVDGKNTF
jgi:hypothetical protein